MGRLVEPYSDSEYNALPRWHRWVVDNIFFVISLTLVLIVSAGYLLIVFAGW